MLRLERLVDGCFIFYFALFFFNHLWLSWIVTTCHATICYHHCLLVLNVMVCLPCLPLTMPPFVTTTVCLFWMLWFACHANHSPCQPFVTTCHANHLSPLSMPTTHYATICYHHCLLVLDVMGCFIFYFALFFLTISGFYELWPCQPLTMLPFVLIAFHLFWPKW